MLKLVSPVTMWLSVLAGWAVIILAVPDRMFYIPSVVDYIFFIAASVIWILTFINSVYHNRGAGRRSVDTPGIIATGPYRHVRHPIYAADIVLAWGFFLIVPLLKVLAGALWMTIVLSLWTILEEIILVRKFGQDYESYRKKTPRFIPRIK